ncbi:MAG: Gfo/Idh/MocA family protein [Myxococcota bacterium]
MGDRRQTPDAIPAVAIFGCGRIGSALDESGSAHVLTHAAACAQHPRLRLAALCDADPERLREAGRARHVSALYTDADALLEGTPIDVAVIATPTHLRTPVVQSALDAGVRTFVIEKPLASSLEEAEHLAQLLRAHDATVSVNYLRRYAAGLIDARERLVRGDLGAPQVARVLYGKGLSNNGSHAIDLMRWWLGEPSQVTALGHVSDGRDDDTTLHAHYTLRTNGGALPVTLQGCDHRAISLFELDVLCAHGRLRLTDRGDQVRISTVTEDPAFPGYSALGAEIVTLGGVSDALAGLWDDLVAVLSGQRDAPRCTLEDGLAALRIVESTRLASRRGEVTQIPDPSMTR